MTNLRQACSTSAHGLLPVSSGNPSNNRFKDMSNIGLGIVVEPLAEEDRVAFSAMFRGCLQGIDFRALNDPLGPEQHEALMQLELWGSINSQVRGRIIEQNGKLLHDRLQEDAASVAAATAADAEQATSGGASAGPQPAVEDEEQGNSVLVKDQAEEPTCFDMLKSGAWGLVTTHMPTSLGVASLAATGTFFVKSCMSESSSISKSPGALDGASKVLVPLGAVAAGASLILLRNLFSKLESEIKDTFDKQDKQRSDEAARLRRNPS